MFREVGKTIGLGEGLWGKSRLKALVMVGEVRMCWGLDNVSDSTRVGMVCVWGGITWVGRRD